MFFFPDFLLQGPVAKRLTAAAVAGNTEIAQKLLVKAKTNDVNHIHKDGNSPLIIACREGRTEIVKLLLAHRDIDVNIRSEIGNVKTALCAASFGGHTEVVKLLLACPRIDINIKGQGGDTALIIASDRGSEEIVDLLMARPEIDANVRGTAQETALHKAVKKAHLKLFFKLLVQHRRQVDVNVQSGVGSVLLEAVSRVKDSSDDFETIITLLVEDRPELDVNMRHKNKKYTALLLASELGYAGVVDRLLGVPNIDVNAQGELGCSALILAVRGGHTAVVKLLLARPDIKVNLKDESGDTALILASKNRRADIVKLLLAHSKIDVNARNGKKETALYYAVAMFQLEAVKMLLGHAKINVTTLIHDEPILIVAMFTEAYQPVHHRTEIIKLLLERPDIDVNDRRRGEDNALVWACWYGDTEIVKMLISFPSIEVNQLGKFRQSPVAQAAYYDHDELIKLLLARPDYDINLRDEDNRTALEYATHYKRLPAVRLIQEHINRGLKKQQDKLDKEKKIRQDREKKDKEEQQRREKEKKATPQSNQRTIIPVGPSTSPPPNTNNSSNYHATFGYPYRRLVPNTHGRSTLTRLTNQNKSAYVDIWVSIFIPDNAPVKGCYTNGGTYVGNVLDGSATPEIIIQSQYMMAKVTVQFEAIEFNHASMNYYETGYKSSTVNKSVTAMTELSRLYSRNLATYTGDTGLLHQWKVGTPFKVTSVEICTNTSGYFNDRASYSSPYTEVPVYYEKGVVLELMDGAFDSSDSFLYSRS